MKTKTTTTVKKTKQPATPPSGHIRVKTSIRAGQEELPPDFGMAGWFGVSDRRLKRTIRRIG